MNPGLIWSDMTWSYCDVFFESTQQVCSWLRPCFSSDTEGEWTQIFHGEYRRGIRSSQSEVSPFAWRNFMAYWATRPLCGNNCFPWWVLCQNNFLNHLNQVVDVGWLLQRFWEARLSLDAIGKNHERCWQSSIKQCRLHTGSQCWQVNRKSSGTLCPFSLPSLRI